MIRLASDEIKRMDRQTICNGVIYILELISVQRKDADERFFKKSHFIIFRAKFSNVAYFMMYCNFVV